MTHPVSSGQSYTVHPTAITVAICHDRKPINVQIILSANVIKYQIQTKYVQFGVIYPCTSRYPFFDVNIFVMRRAPNVEPAVVSRLKSGFLIEPDRKTPF